MVIPRRDFTLLLSLWTMTLLRDMGGILAMPCPAQCKCFPGELRVHVHCTGLNLTEMPQFPQSMHVELLNLSSNSISVLPSNSFREPQVLTELYLDHNALKVLPIGGLARMRSLTVLDLGHNHLRILHVDAFRDLTSLRVLVLTANQLPSIASGLFQLNPDLTVLDLSRNRLISVPRGALRDPTVLSSLDLSHNPISGIDAGDFSSVPSLQTLRMAYLSLEATLPGMFSSLTHLQLLDLSYNKLTRVDSSTVSGLPELRSLDLTGNPLLCNCDMVDLYNWIHVVADTVSVQAYCRLPRKLSGSSVFDIPVEQFTSCHDGATGGGNVSTETMKGPASGWDNDGQEVYNPMLGWYTAATLSGMLMAFLVCLTLDKLKQRLAKYYRTQKRRREMMKYKQSLQETNKAELKEATTTLVPRVQSREKLCDKQSNPLERANSLNEKPSGKNNTNTNSAVSRTPSVRNKPKLTLTLPESNNELELQGTLKKKPESNHSNRTITLEMETPPVNAFRVHPNCPIHSPNGAKNIHVIEDLESCL